MLLHLADREHIFCSISFFFSIALSLSLYISFSFIFSFSLDNRTCTSQNVAYFRYDNVLLVVSYLPASFCILLQKINIYIVDDTRH